MKRLVVSGYHGFDNTGDEAILQGLLQELRAAAGEIQEQVHFTVLSANPPKTSCSYGVDAIKRTNPIALLKAISQSRAVLSGGGGLLQDVTGRYTAAYYLAPCLLAFVLGKPFILYAHGIGPLRGKINRLLTRLVLNRAACITVRDEQSRQLLQEIGVKKPASLTADPAFCLKPQESDTTLALIDALPLQKPRLALCLRPWPGLRLQKVAAAVNAFCRETGAAAVIIPFLPQTDLPLAQELAKMLTCPLKIVEETLSPAEIMALMAEMDMVLAMRLHALIFATAAGTAPVAISYDPKVDSYMEQIGLRTAGRADSLSQANLLGELYYCWEHKKQLSRELSSAAGTFRKQARQTARVTARLLADL